MAADDKLPSKHAGGGGISLKDETQAVLKKPVSARRRRIELCSAGSVAAKRPKDPSEEGSISSSPPDRDADDGLIGILAVGRDVGVAERQKGPPRVAVHSHGAVSLIGRRREMEDAVSVAPEFATFSGHDFFGVYDGHGGAGVAHMCRERLHVVLSEEVAAGGWPRAEGRWKEVMSASFSRLDEEVEAMAWGESSERTMGSTAVVAVVGTNRIVVANCGDSRAVLCRGGAAVPLSFDHKVNLLRTALFF